MATSAKYWLPLGVRGELTPSLIAVAVAQPQVESDAFALLPALSDAEIGLAVQRVDGALSRVVIVTADRSLAADVVL
jgi:hypothetical protein